MPKLAVDGGKVKIHYEVKGKGKTKVILIIGFSTTYTSWEKQFEYFGDKHGDEFTVCVFDNRGMGKSDVVVGAYTTKRMAQDVLELLDHLNWPVYNIIGVSMGGMIAQKLAVLAPHRVQSLCLCVTHSGGLYAFPTLYGILSAGMVVPAQKLSKRQEANFYLNLQFSQEYLESECNGRKMRDLLIEEFLKHRKTEGTPSLIGLAGQLAAVSRHYVSTDRLLKLKQSLEITKSPVLILTGTEDHLVRPVNSFILHQILGCRLVVFDGAGHHIHQQCMDTFNEIVLNHLRLAAVQSKADGTPKLLSKL